jgi:hypothetical protein
MDPEDRFLNPLMVVSRSTTAYEKGAELTSWPGTGDEKCVRAAGDIVVSNLAASCCPTTWLARTLRCSSAEATMTAATRKSCGWQPFPPTACGERQGDESYGEGAMYGGLDIAESARLPLAVRHANHGQPFGILPLYSGERAGRRSSERACAGAGTNLVMDDSGCWADCLSSPVVCPSLFLVLPWHWRLRGTEGVQKGAKLPPRPLTWRFSSPATNTLAL